MQRVTNFKIANTLGIDVRSINKIVDSIGCKKQIVEKKGSQGGHNKNEYSISDKDAMMVCLYTKKTPKSDLFRVLLINSINDLGVRVKSVSKVLDELLLES